MSLFEKSIKSKNQQIFSPLLEQKNIELFIKREDLIHPFVSGNKFRKLKYNIQKAKKEGFETILTFGGAYSNHIVATAVASSIAGLKSIGVIRGEELANDINKTLSNNYSLKIADKHKMLFHFISRTDFKKKTNFNFIERLKKQYGDFYLVPEGGTNSLAIQGCEEILENEDTKFDYICCSVGTGGTISGIINSAQTHQKIIGFPALKGDFLNKEIEKLIQKSKQSWRLETNYHFGGYAKHEEKLIQFINNFNQQHKILLDPIYTGKMVYGILDLIEKGYFAKKSRILAIHTGGIQGIQGFNKKLINKNKTPIQF